MKKVVLDLKNQFKTAVLGKALAHVLNSGMKLYLHGDLGSGKTTLVRALIQETGYKGAVKSPTYSLAEPYDIHVSNKTVKLLHCDLYRISNPDEFEEAGLLENFDDETICLVEWAENAAFLLPEPDIRIRFYINGQGRKAILEALTEAGSNSLKYLRFDPDAHI